MTVYHQDLRDLARRLTTMREELTALGCDVLGNVTVTMGMHELETVIRLLDTLPPIGASYPCPACGGTGKAIERADT